MGRGDHRLDLKLIPGLGTPTSHRLRPNQGTPRIVAAGRAHSILGSTFSAGQRPLIRAGAGHEPLHSLPATLRPKHAAHVRGKRTSYPLYE
jgi:hypothetical protein